MRDVGPVRNPVLSHRVRLFSLVPLVWESNPNSRVAGARPNHQADRDLIPTIGGSGAHPGRGMGLRHALFNNTRTKKNMTQEMIWGSSPMAHQPAKLEAAHSAAHYGLILFATSQFEHVRGEGHANNGVVTLNRPPASLLVD